MTEKDSEVEQLESRIEQLEELVAKMMPSRRDALKLGGAAVLGGAAMSSRASAGTQQVGTIGTAGSPVDVEAEDISASDTTATANLSVSSAVISSLNLDNNDITNLDQLNGDALVTSGETNDFEVQKDGSDATGVINFKTS